MGVPGLAGFISKWNLASAAVESGNPVAYFGIACLLISALLTAIYMLTIVVRAFFPGKDFDDSSIKEFKEEAWRNRSAQTSASARTDTGRVRK